MTRGSDLAMKPSRSALLWATLGAVVLAGVLLWEPGIARLPLEELPSIPIARDPRDLSTQQRTDVTSREPIPAGPYVEVVVIGGADKVENASVVACDGGMPVRAVTNGLGVAKLRMVDTTSTACAIQVTAPGYAASTSWHRDPSANPITIHLTTMGITITGDVRLKNGGVPVADIEAVAWPAALPQHEVLALVAAREGIRGKVQSGTFALENLQASVAYRVGVSGAGWTCNPIMTVEPQQPGGITPPVHLTACRLYGVVLMAVGPGGIAPARSDVAYLTYGAGPGKVTPLTVGHQVHWVLSGLWHAARGYDPKDHWAKALISFRAYEDLPSLEASVRYNVPGYEPALVEVIVPPQVAFGRVPPASKGPLLVASE